MADLCTCGHPGDWHDPDIGCAAMDPDTASGGKCTCTIYRASVAGGDGPAFTPAPTVASAHDPLNRVAFSISDEQGGQQMVVTLDAAKAIRDAAVNDANAQGIAAFADPARRAELTGQLCEVGFLCPFASYGGIPVFAVAGLNTWEATDG